MQIRTIKISFADRSIIWPQNDHICPIIGDLSITSRKEITFALKYNKYENSIMAEDCRMQTDDIRRNTH